MLYLLYGPNSLEAAKKIKEIKREFFKKNPSFLLEEIDGDDYGTHHDLVEFIESQSLFSQKRLVVLKNTLSRIQNAEKFFVKYLYFLKDSKDIFLFCEKNLKKDNKIFQLFKKNSIKIQETKEEKKDFYTPSSNSIFRFVDKIFVSSSAESLLHLESAKMAGIDAKNLVNVIFWKLKKIQKKDKRTLDLAYKAILADLNLKMDKGGEEEHLSRLVYSIASKSPT